MSDDRDRPRMDPEVTWGGPNIFPIQAAYERRHHGGDQGAHHEPMRPAPPPGPHPDDFTPGGRAWRERELIELEIQHRSLGP